MSSPTKEAIQTAAVFWGERLGDKLNVRISWTGFGARTPEKYLADHRTAARALEFVDTTFAPTLSKDWNAQAYWSEDRTVFARNAWADPTAALIELARVVRESPHAS